MKHSRAQDQLDIFMEEYETQLCKAVVEHPDEYMYDVAEVPAVLGRMRVAIERNSFNKDSRAIRATCKTLGIKHTYQGIRSFLVQSDLCVPAKW